MSLYHMNILLHTPIGTESITADEVETLTGHQPDTTAPGRLRLEADEEAIFRCNYQAGSLTRVIHLLHTFTLETPSDAYDTLDTDFSRIMDPDQTFAVRVERHGEHAFTSTDIARKAGQRIVEQIEDTTGTTPDVDLDDPDVIFRLELRDTEATFGVDTTGTTLDERHYLTHRSEQTTSPVLAQHLIRHSDWTPEQDLLDPFCRSGTVAIEAGRIQCNIPNAGRQFGFLDLNHLEKATYGTVAQEAKQTMSITDVPIEASDLEPDHAETHAKEAGLDIPVTERDPQDRPLTGDMLLFHAPFQEQRSKRDQLQNVVRAVEDRFDDSQITYAAALTQDKSMFSSIDTATPIELGQFNGSIIEWHLG